MQIRQLVKNEDIPYDLLLLADPSRTVVDNYLNRDYTYVAEQNNEIIGIVVLFPLDNKSIEIKNIAVREDFQKKGIGVVLLNHAEMVAQKLGYKFLIIGTADISGSPIVLYEKFGFCRYGVKKNFFVENYDEPIVDNGFQCIDMVMLKKEIS